MNLLVNILRKIHVIHAAHDGNRFDFHLIEMSMGKEEIKTEKCLNGMSAADFTSKKFATPLILVISGKGVISKSYKENSEELKQITDRLDDFLFAKEVIGNGIVKVTFLRRKLYEVLCKELNIESLPLIEVRIDANNNPQEEAKKAAEEFQISGFSIRDVFTPSIRSSKLLSLVAGKILLPALLILLAILLVNFFVQQDIASRLKEQQFLLTQVKRNTDQAEKKQGERQQILEQLVNEPGYPYAWIADRIASVVPDEIILAELNIQPLKDRIQRNKPLNVERDKVVIKGTSINSTSVTAFTDSIQGLRIFKTVQLDMLNKDRNGNYQFTLNISL